MSGLAGLLRVLYRRRNTPETVSQTSIRDEEAINAIVKYLGGLTVNEADLVAVAAADDAQSEWAILAGIKPGWLPREYFAARAAENDVPRELFNSAMEAAVERNFVNDHRDYGVQLTFLGLTAFARPRYASAWSNPASLQPQAF